MLEWRENAEGEEVAGSSDLAAESRSRGCSTGGRSLECQLFLQIFAVLLCLIRLRSGYFDLSQRIALSTLLQQTLSSRSRCKERERDRQRQGVPGQLRRMVGQVVRSAADDQEQRARATGYHWQPDLGTQLPLEAVEQHEEQPPTTLDRPGQAGKHEQPHRKHFSSVLKRIRADLAPIAAV